MTRASGSKPAGCPRSRRGSNHAGFTSAAARIVGALVGHRHAGALTVHAHPAAPVLPTVTGRAGVGATGQTGVAHASVVCRQVLAADFSAAALGAARADRFRRDASARCGPARASAAARPGSGPGSRRTRGAGPGRPAGRTGRAGAHRTSPVDDPALDAPDELPAGVAVVPPLMLVPAQPADSSASTATGVFTVRPRSRPIAR